MQKENTVTLTGTYKTEQVTANFEKQMLVFASKDKDGTWKDGNFDCYLKQDLAAQSGVQPGDTIKVGGFLVFNFFTKQDGTQMTFPKLIVTEIKEVEKAGAAAPQAQAAPAQPAYAAPTAPGMPQAPTAPGMPQAPAYAAPQAPGMPQAPQAPGMPA